MSQPALKSGSMRIGELSRRSGVSVRLLRYYEEQGLLAPSRSSSGYREYDAGTLRILEHIRSLLGAGLTTRVIADVLPCIRDDGPSIVPTCPRTRAQIAAERDRITTAIGDLRRSQQLLDGIVNADQ